MIRINCDKDWKTLRRKNEKADTFGVFERETVYGSKDAEEYGMKPFGEAFPDKLVAEKDYKDVINECEEQRIFPVYHQKDTWCPVGKRYNQNGLPYCWAWGMASTLMDCRAREGKPIIQLAPVSLGHTVGWKSRGNYLESAIKGASERGICSSKFVPNQHSRNYKGYKDGWEDDAMKQRLGEVWDTDKRNMIQHAISILRCGVSLYIAYNWWSHALACVGVRWDESERNNLVWLIRNSHNEDDVIELTGSRGVPSEAFGIRSSIS